MAQFEQFPTFFETLKAWENRTFDDGFEALKNKEGTDPNVLAMLESVIKIQKLNQKHMNGTSVRKLLKTEVEGSGIYFSQIFDYLENRHSEMQIPWDLTDVLYVVCEQINNLDAKIKEIAKQKKVSYEKMAAYLCGRAMRSIPSYIRERQLASMLKARLPNADILHDNDLDMQMHCDILVKYQGENYMLWSYTYTDQAIKKLAKKFFNKYNPIPNGLHIICPCEMEHKYLDWSLYTADTANMIIQVMSQQPTQIANSWSVRQQCKPALIIK